MKKIRSILFVAGVNVAILAVMLEFAGLGAYFVAHDELFYIRSGNAGAAVVEATEQSPKGMLVLHPYLGYIHYSGLTMQQVADSDRMSRLLYGAKNMLPQWATSKTNNYGFFSPHDYPYKKRTSKEMIIGVFGGSVAHWFSLQGADQLRQRIKEFPEFRGKDITILNFSQGGYKQPQQLQALSYFLSLGQEFDFVLNIDGFNEIALSYLNHASRVDGSMPSAQHMLPIIKVLDGDYRYFDVAYKLKKSGERAKRMGMARSETQSAALYLVYSMLYSISNREYTQAAQKIDSFRESLGNTDIVSVAQLPDNYDIDDSLGDILYEWSNSTLVIQGICDAKGIPYLEVIQPNQYFSHKHFSEAERLLAISEEIPYRKPVEQGYPELDSFVRDLRSKGVNIYSAVRIFDDVKEIVYSDNCCHYNQIGNELFADHIAKLMGVLLE